MNILKQLLLLAAISCTSQLLKANKGEGIDKNSVEGCLHGYVMDAVTGKPITGVTVSVSSKKLHGSKIQSDAAGYFHFAKLPPGEVTVMFEKKGYQLFRRDLPNVKEGVITKISVDVKPVEDDGSNELWHPLYKMLN
ncbi:MAG: carboxypeptidase-like regulatory domain-containing protein [Chitinophagaceae bacterium]